jgi:hypothetical protein
MAFWVVFAWFGRACDQAAGVLLNPIVVGVFALAVERDPFRLAWLLTAYSWGWLVGSAVTPLLQQITVRVMPWIVGGYVVRVAAIALMTFAVTDEGSSQGQRFTSMLICYATYALATGMARTAQARHLFHGAPGRLWDTSRPITRLGLAAVTAIAALSAWSSLSTRAMSWSSSFGRIFVLAAMALGVACLAAIREGVDNPEAPNIQGRLVDAERKPSWVPGSVILVSIGVAALLLFEVLAFVHLFVEFRRQTVLIRGGIAFFAVGWTVGTVFWSQVRPRLSPALLAQAAITAGASGIVLSLATPNVARADWFPDSFADRSTESVLIYLTGFLIGLGVSGRRLLLAPPYEHPYSAASWSGLAVGGVSGAMPLIAGLAARGVSREWALIGGLVIALFVLGAIGSLPAAANGTSPRRTPAAPVRPALLPRD